MKERHRNDSLRSSNPFPKFFIVVNTIFITAMKRFMFNSQIVLLVSAYLWLSSPAAGLSLGKETERHMNIHSTNCILKRILYVVK